MSAAVGANLLCDEDLAETDDVLRSDGHATAAGFRPPAPDYSSFADIDESCFIDRLLDSEHLHLPLPDYFHVSPNRSVFLANRQDSINAILKVCAHFGFKPATAFLSVNYFDRFLSNHTLPESGWPFHLLSIACLSLAAKMEEVYVPLLLDLQIFESNYVFEPVTIQRMELLVMSTLKWRLRSVTPFDFLHYFVSLLGSKADSFSRLQSLASDIVLSTIRVVDFLGVKPSVIAAAAVISVSGEDMVSISAIDERIDTEKVISCHQLIQEYLLDTCPSWGVKPTFIEPPAPSSPVGVLDAADCASCYTQTENQTTVSGSRSDTAEPETKRRRLSGADDVQQP